MKLTRVFEKSERIEEPAQFFILCGRRLGATFSRQLFEEFGTSDPADKMAPQDFANLVSSARMSIAAMKLFRQEPLESIVAVSVTCRVPANGFGGCWEFRFDEKDGVTVSLAVDVGVEKRTGDLGDYLVLVYDCSVVLSGEEAPLRAFAERCSGTWE